MRSIAQPPEIQTHGERPSEPLQSLQFEILYCSFVDRTPIFSIGWDKAGFKDSYISEITIRSTIRMAWSILSWLNHLWLKQNLPTSAGLDTAIHVGNLKVGVDTTRAWIFSGGVFARCLDTRCIRFHPAIYPLQ